MSPLTIGILAVIVIAVIAFGRVTWALFRKAKL